MSTSDELALEKFIVSETSTYLKLFVGIRTVYREDPKAPGILSTITISPFGASEKRLVVPCFLLGEL